MKLELSVVAGEKEGETFYISEGEQLVIGRDTSTDMQLEEPGISRSHARVRLVRGRAIVEDLKSSNGTQVNGNRVETAHLEDGDLIQIGSTQMLVSLREKVAEEERRKEEELVVQLNRSPFDFSQTQIMKRYDSEREGLFVSGEGKLLDQYKIAHKSLETLYRVVSVIQQEEELGSLFESIMDAIFQVFKADRSLLIMRDEDFQALEPVVFRLAPKAPADSHVSISQTVVNEVVEKGISILTLDAQSDERFKSGDSVVMEGIRSVMCVPVQARDHILGAIYLDTIGHPGKFSESGLELLSAIGSEAGMAIQRAKLLDDIVMTYYSTVRALVAAVEAKDSYTRGHSERVTAYAITLGRVLGLNEHSLDTLRLAGLMHDIGKISVPESVLNKPGKLNEEEWQIMRRHPEVGASIIKNIRGQDIGLIARIVLHHHERVDGTGYPAGLASEDIPLMARILAVADAYDAMTSRRPYRGAFRKEKVVSQIKEGKGSQFDGTAAEAMLELVQTDQVVPIVGDGATGTQ